MLAETTIGWAVGTALDHGLQWVGRALGDGDQAVILDRTIGLVVADIPQPDRTTVAEVLRVHLGGRPRWRQEGAAEPGSLVAGIIDQLQPALEGRVERRGRRGRGRGFETGRELLSRCGLDLPQLAARVEQKLLAVMKEIARDRGGVVEEVRQQDTARIENMQREHGEWLGRLDDLAERTLTGVHALDEKVDAVLDEPHPEGPPRQLPHDRGDFTGRARELFALRERAAAERGTLVISAVSGKPGVGKSTLAVHFARQLADSYPDAHLYADLRGTDASPRDCADVLGGFLRALGRRRADIPVGVEERAADYRSLLSGKRAVIVLDNADDEAQVRPMLPGAPTCLLVVTSRRDLVIEGAEPLVLDAMDEAEGIELFTPGVETSPAHSVGRVGTATWSRPPTSPPVEAAEPPPPPSRWR